MHVKRNEKKDGSKGKQKKEQKWKRKNGRREMKGKWGVSKKFDIEVI